MSEQHSPETSSQGFTHTDSHSELFAQLVLQQTNLALMLLGKVAHPESGKTYKDVEGARLFIDQLEMIEAKTRGNLTKEESALLKQSLMNLRLAFVDTVESSSQVEQKTQGAAQTSPVPDVSQAGSAAPGPEGPASPSDEDEHRKKFSKKY